ncbi:MAG: flippase-like domain-containing protein [Syntrophomonadaceae bacterium]
MRRFERLVFAAGVLLFAALVYRIGPERIGRQLLEVGWGFLAVLALSALPLLANALSWRELLPGGRRLPVRTMARMLVSGEAVNAVSPVGVVGGELVRLSQLSEHFPAEDAAASVAMAAMAQFAGQIVFIVSGLPLAMTLLPGEAWRRGLLAFAAVLLLLLAVVLSLAWSQTVRAQAASVLRRVPSARRLVARVPETWRAAGSEMLAALRARPHRFGAAAGLSLLAWQVGAVETWLVLRLLGSPVGAAAAYALEVLAVAIEGIFFFVPAKIGTQEGGKVLIFLAAGLDPSKGFTLGLVRRLREQFWAVIGLALLGSRPRRRLPRATPARAVIPRG